MEIYDFKKLQNGMQQEAKMLRDVQPLSAQEVLRRLILQVKKINFAELLLTQEGKDKPKQKNYVVIIIEEILRVAETNNWGLCRQHDFVYVYNGQFWQLVLKEELKRFLGKAAEKLGYSSLESRYYEFRDKLYKQFLSAASLPVLQTQKDKVLINLKNGTVEITAYGMQIRDFDQADFMTYQLPFAYKQSASCPIFMRFIDEVLPDPSLQTILAEFFAYIFTKHLKLEKCLLLYGTGANGKSVFFEIINSLIGQGNISNLSLGNLKEEHNRALIKNKLLNYGSEIRGNIEADIFKQLVSGEPIQARLKYGNTFIMRDYAKLAFNCNTLPRDVEQTNAYFRRFIIVPFEVTIPEERQDPLLAQKIIDKELSGVFNWILLGLSRLLSQNAFTQCDRIRQEIENYKKESDSVWTFLDDNNYVKSVIQKQYLKDLYRMYRAACLENGCRSVSIQNFSKRIQNRGFEVIKEKLGRVVFLEKNEKK